MITDRKREAARRNGALSRGPVTDVGKRRSSQNRRTHGFYASANPVTPEASLAGLVVLTHESPEVFESFRASFHARFCPADAVEAEQVDSMVNARWHLKRVSLVETTLLEHEMARLQPYFAQTYVGPSVALQMSLAYQSLNEETTTARALQMHLSRLSRQYLNASRELERLQCSRRQQEELAESGFVEPELSEPESFPASSPSTEPENSISRFEPTGEQPALNQSLAGVPEPEPSSRLESSALPHTPLTLAPAQQVVTINKARWELFAAAARWIVNRLPSMSRILDPHGHRVMGGLHMETEPWSATVCR